MWRARRASMGLAGTLISWCARQKALPVNDWVETSKQVRSGKVGVGGELYGRHRGEALAGGASQVAGLSKGHGVAGGGWPWARRRANQRAVAVTPTQVASNIGRSPCLHPISAGGQGLNWAWALV